MNINLTFFNEHQEEILNLLKEQQVSPTKLLVCVRQNTVYVFSENNTYGLQLSFIALCNKYRLICDIQFLARSTYEKRKNAFPQAILLSQLYNDQKATQVIDCRSKNYADSESKSTTTETDDHSETLSEKLMHLLCDAVNHNDNENFDRNVVSMMLDYLDNQIIIQNNNSLSLINSIELNYNNQSQIKFNGRLNQNIQLYSPIQGAFDQNVFVEQLFMKLRSAISPREACLAWNAADASFTLDLSKDSFFNHQLGSEKLLEELSIQQIDKNSTHLIHSFLKKQQNNTSIAEGSNNYFVMLDKKFVIKIENNKGKITLKIGFRKNKDQIFQKEDQNHLTALIMQGYHRKKKKDSKHKPNMIPFSSIEFDDTFKSKDQFISVFKAITDFSALKIQLSDVKKVLEDFLEAVIEIDQSKVGLQFRFHPALDKEVNQLIERMCRETENPLLQAARQRRGSVSKPTQRINILLQQISKQAEEMKGLAKQLQPIQPIQPLSSQALSSSSMRMEIKSYSTATSTASGPALKTIIAAPVITCGLFRPIEPAVAISNSKIDETIRFLAFE